MTELSPERLVEVLDRHGVEYLIVGGVAARAYGASRQTKDIDCLVRGTRANLDRLAAAMRELHARLRVEGLSDAEAALLPMQIDAVTLNAVEVSTWRTDAGDLDVLVDIPGRNGERRRYEDLAAASRDLDYEGIAVRVAGAIGRALDPHLLPARHLQPHRRRRLPRPLARMWWSPRPTSTSRRLAYGHGGSATMVE